MTMASRISRSEIAVFARMFPARMKNGTARRVHESVALKSCWGMSCSGARSKASTERTLEMPSAAAIGKFRNSRTVKLPNRSSGTSGSIGQMPDVPGAVSGAPRR